VHPLEFGHGEMFPALCGSDVVGRNIQDAYQLPDGHVILNMLRDTLEGESIHMPAHPIPAGGRYVEKFTHPIWSARRSSAESSSSATSPTRILPGWNW